MIANYVQNSDGFDASEYKVSLASEPFGAVIGEASFVGAPPFQYICTLHAKFGLNLCIV